ncbi:uncharacterized protein LOC131949144 [Physella acuta]|uniref:uncharacterized protein LOC131949144 n=1 Tax=Physella acuta TaxID=109671 RepID=UPI0027DD8742|nr:uncharacterized protein LOC131949144 [Physella acuta]
MSVMTMHSSSNADCDDCEVDLLFSWNLDKRSKSITTCFIDLDKFTTEVQQIEESVNDLEEKYSLSFGYNKYVDTMNGIQLSCNKEVVESSNCILTVQTLKSDSTRINGICIISESRTLEVSNDMDGYLTTIRGKQLFNCIDKEEGHKKLYLCKCLFDESYTNLTVKFLSLGGSSFFTVTSLIICLDKQVENYVHVSHGAFDMTKLKKDVDKMGYTISDKAKSFLATMEQFEQNKVKSFGGLLTSNHPATTSSKPVISDIMNSVLGQSAMRSLLGKSPQLDSGSRGEESNIYSMLQAVCGNVSQMRESSKKENINGSTFSPDSGNGSLSRTLSVDAVDTDCNKDNKELLEIIDQKIQQAKTELQDTLAETAEKLTLQIETAKSEINQKLDTVLELLKHISKTNEMPQTQMHSEQLIVDKS